MEARIKTEDNVNSRKNLSVKDCSRLESIMDLENVASSYDKIKNKKEGRFFPSTNSVTVVNHAPTVVKFG